MRWRRPVSHWSLVYLLGISLTLCSAGWGELQRPGQPGVDGQESDSPEECRRSLGPFPMAPKAKPQYILGGKIAACHVPEGEGWNAASKANNWEPPTDKEREACSARKVWKEICITCNCRNTKGDRGTLKCPEDIQICWEHETGCEVEEKFMGPIRPPGVPRFSYTCSPIPDKDHPRSVWDAGFLPEKDLLSECNNYCMGK